MSALLTAPQMQSFRSVKCALFFGNSEKFQCRKRHSDNSYQAIIHINMEKATTHIKFANGLQILKFYFKNKLLTNIINCNSKFQNYTDIYHELLLLFFKF